MASVSHLVWAVFAMTPAAWSGNPPKPGLPSLKQPITEMNLTDPMRRRLREVDIQSLADFEKLTMIEAQRLVGVKAVRRVEDDLRSNGLRFRGEPNDDLSNLNLSSNSERTLRRMGWTTLEQLTALNLQDVRRALPAFTITCDIAFKELTAALARGSAPLPAREGAANEVSPSIFNLPITELPLPEGGVEKLHSRGVRVMSGFTRLSSPDVFQILGTRTWQTIRHKMRVNGLRFLDDPPDDLSRLDVGHVTETILRAAHLTSVAQLSRLTLNDFRSLPRTTPGHFEDLSRALRRGPIEPVFLSSERVRRANDWPIEVISPPVVSPLHQRIETLDLSRRVIHRLHARNIVILEDLTVVPYAVVFTLAGVGGARILRRELRLNGLGFKGDPEDDLSRLDVTTSTELGLRKAGLTSLPQLESLTAAEFKSITSLGDRDWTDLREALAIGPIQPQLRLGAHDVAFRDRLLEIKPSRPGSKIEAACEELLDFLRSQEEPP